MDDKDRADAVWITEIREQWQRDYGFTAPDEFIAKHVAYAETLNKLSDAMASALADLYWLMTDDRFSDSVLTRELRRRGLLKRLEGALSVWLEAGGRDSQPRRPAQRIKAVGLFGRTWLDISARVGDFSRIAEHVRKTEVTPPLGSHQYTIRYTHARQDSEMPEVIVMLIGNTVLQVRVDAIAEREVIGDVAWSVLILTPVKGDDVVP